MTKTRANVQKEAVGVVVTATHEFPTHVALKLPHNMDMYPSVNAGRVGGTNSCSALFILVTYKIASIRELDRLRKEYGGTRWRKLKGVAFVRTVDGEEFWAEIHWYECHGIGRRDTKVARELE